MLNLLGPTYRAHVPTLGPFIHMYVSNLFDMFIRIASAHPTPQPGLQPAYPHDSPFLPLSLCQYHLFSRSLCPSTFLGQKHTHSLNATISNTPSSLKHLLPVPKCK